MDWIYSTSDPLLPTFLGSVMLFIVILVFTRKIGLRAFAKFTAYDFAFTIAVGSIISSTLTSDTSIVHGNVAIITFIFDIYFLTYTAGYAQIKIIGIQQNIVTNEWK